jgi:hypothetical protein
MSAFKPTGFSVTKVVITALVWNAFAVSLLYAMGNFKLVRQRMPHYAFVFFVALILWNIIGIAASFMEGSMATTTLLGNPYTSLALLVPLALPFGLDKSHLRIVNRYFLILVMVGLVSSAVTFFSLLIAETEESTLGLPSLFLYLAAFLITTIPFQSQRSKIVILAAGAILFFFTGIIGGSRATLLRIVLLFLSLLALGLYKKFQMRWITAAALCTFLVPFYLVYTGTVTGQSFFQDARNYILDTVGSSHPSQILEKADTRTFLYREVFDDLMLNDQWLTGKGSGGTYFSPYFLHVGADIDRRFTAEVGIVALLLKGGLIAVFLNLSLFLIAIFLAFYRANNYYVMAVGFMLLVHVFILFAENLVSYNLYNFAVWFFVGVCLSSDIRSLNGNQIKDLLLGTANV